MKKEKIAVIIPCYNEAMTIGKVIDDFRKELPDADIYVYDNNSSDDTSKIAKEHGAIVRVESRQGKGRVVRQMHRDITADYYVMVDGDDTYPAEFVHDMLKPLRENKADMTIGDRLSNGTYGSENDRAFHGLGNNLVRWMIKVIYGHNFKDVMTGYRAYNTVFAKAMPVLSPGFQIETELSIHAVDKSWRVMEVPIDYRDRPEGSESKLSTFSDGFKVISMIMTLFKEYKPMELFGIIAAIFLIVGLIFGIPIIVEYANTGLVPRFPTAILSVGLIFIAILNFVTGLILGSVVKGQRMQYEIEVNRIYDMYR
ncbi:MAG: glycosyltransferase family 2 protein [Coriobacteriia bacterium]|nr:glycosyltransferase family 2 protein [Coriobacteriia bacterium]